MPKATVLIAAYNAAHFLPDCLNSLLAQTMADWEAAFNKFEIHRWQNFVGLYYVFLQSRDRFSRQEQAEIEARFERLLPTIERSRIPWRMKMKLGHYPFRSYKAFTRCFGLRQWAKRLIMGKKKA